MGVEAGRRAQWRVAASGGGGGGRGGQLRASPACYNRPEKLTARAQRVVGAQSSKAALAVSSSV